MKKLLCILSFLISSFALFAQNPNAYRFSFDTTPYVELSGATVVGSKLLGDNFDSKWIVGDTGYAAFISAPDPSKRDSIIHGRGIAIGFNFPFAKNTFSHFSILSNGAIFLGNSADSILVGTYSNGPLYAPHTQNIISFAASKDWVWSFDTVTPVGTPTTTISYKTEGTTGNHTLTIQFKNLKYISSSTGYGSSVKPKTIDTLNFQIIIHENGQIVYHIGKSVATNTSNRSMYVGFKSTSINSPDYYTRSISSSTYGTNGLQNWSNSIAGTSASSTCAFFDKKYPTTNLRYIFDTPIACVSPDAINNAFEFSSLSNSSLKYTLTQNPNSNGSLVIWSREPILTFKPIDGKTYGLTDTLGNGKGNGYVCNVSTSVNSPLSGSLGFSETLLPGTKYYLHAFALNNLCMGDVPLYASTARIDSIVTLPSATNISLISNDSTKASFALNIPQDYSALIFKSTKYPTEVLAPTKAMKVGDSLSDGSVLVYKGKDATVSFTNLKSGSIYYFTTWTLATDSTYGPDYEIAGVQMTPGTLPFTFDFANQASGQPLGWKGAFRIFTTTLPSYTLLAVDILKCSAGGDTCTNFRKQVSLSSPIQLSTGKHRISFDYIIGNNGVPRDRFNPEQPMSGVALPETDSLLVSITTDGSNFIPIGNISAADHPMVTANFTNQTMDINSKELDSKLIQIRIETVSKGSIPYYYFIQNLNIKQVLNECETPVNLSIIDSTITSTEAQIKWTDFKGTNYNQWNISYKKTSDLHWSEALLVKSNPYTLGFLDPQSTYQVRVQAVCSKESQSDWSSVSKPFSTLYGVPFGTNFAKADWDTVFPIDWSRMRGKISATTGIASSFSDAPTSWRWWNWKNIKEGEDAFRCAFETSAAYWFMTPNFNLAKDNDALLNFDLALMKGSGPEFVDSVKDARFLVIISTDGGKTFNIKDTLLSYGQGCAKKLENIQGIPISIPLKAYNGNVKIGFYVENLKNGVDAFIQLAHLLVSPSCLPAIKPVISNLKENSATITWSTSEPSPEWLVRYKTTTESTYSYASSNTNTIHISNLQASTAYDFGIRSVCQAGDSSTWLSGNFTTTDPHFCDTVKRARRIDYDQTFARIAWVGEAFLYNFKYKKLNETNWIPSTTKDTTILLENLEKNTEYTFSVQAQCSQNTADTSLWTTPGKFKTLGVTCLVPDSIHLAILKYGSATIRWKRTANAYQYNYKSPTDTRWYNGFIGDYTGIGINGLVPETDYMYRMRTICTVGDTSEWSTILEFRTTAKPECGQPINLSIKDISTNSATLSWQAGLNNFLYTVRGKSNKETKWDTIFMGTDKTSFIWSNLKPETVYAWAVQSICDAYQYDPSISAWANSNFTTTPTSIQGNISAKDAFQVSAKDGQLHIINLRQTYISKIEIFNTIGQSLRSYNVNSSDNILIPTTLNTHSVAIVRITTIDGNISYKLYF
ncbi:MAG: fibronectin type III domain-containing protein [Bacteroidales bacterium]